MDKLNFYYHVVPIDDGYTFLCKNRNTGELYLHQKTLDNNPESLIFSSEQSAKEWIEWVGLPQGHFKPEWFGTIDVVEEFADVR